MTRQPRGGGGSQPPGLLTVGPAYPALPALLLGYSTCTLSLDTPAPGWGWGGGLGACESQRGRTGHRGRGLVRGLWGKRLGRGLVSDVRGELLPGGFTSADWLPEQVVSKSPFLPPVNKNFVYLLQKICKTHKNKKRGIKYI